ncbi:MAG: hypothetical protein AB8H80_22585 [Planctomycetota bacterium]
MIQPCRFGVSLALAGIVVLAASGSVALAQAPESAPEPRQPTVVVSTAASDSQKPPFVFEAGGIELEQLVERCATYLDRNVMLYEDEVKYANAASKVVFDRPVVTDRDGCEDLLSSILWSRGLVILPMDAGKAVYEVLARKGNRRGDVRTRSVYVEPEQVLSRPGFYRMVTCCYHLQNTRAQLACNTLRPFLSQWSGNGAMRVDVGMLGNDASLLFSGPQPQIAILLQMLQRADKAPGEGLNGVMENRLADLKKDNEGLAQDVRVLQQRLAQLVKQVESLSKARKPADADNGGSGGGR